LTRRTITLTCNDGLSIRRSWRPLLLVGLELIICGSLVTIVALRSITQISLAVLSAIFAAPYRSSTGSIFCTHLIEIALP
jgi:hypothetical protein